MTLINIGDKERDAIFLLAGMLDELGYAKRGSLGEHFSNFANRLDETGAMQNPDPERCETCAGSGWVERIGT